MSEVGKGVIGDLLGIEGVHALQDDDDDNNGEIIGGYDPPNNTNEGKHDSRSESATMTWSLETS